MSIARNFVCAVDDLEDGESMTVESGALTGIEEPVAVYRVDGEFFATSDTCTHEKWSLGEEGDLEGHEILCTLHNARFDVRSGEPLCFPAVLRLKSYATSVEDGRVYITAGGRGEHEH
ncbi:non-heme iron oxygenase ferredoxin subunit [Streptomyces bacillaris]|uniref:non-heme iron oxygenase ferredoxin subunit n=1 Tax=Streptomyces TaxID=1883 RepID=UPI0002E18047|nr:MULTISPECIES: non-heme iron oxygenase ferredoxin subunit [Streptomyces]MYR36095.1 Rieske 2Fe-2S domain-containing protein [Streptomyces sp. SID4944]ALC25988.1 ferredoxin [Streptomyces sp. CFMR 7]MBT3074823.1 non-heme iron oxygenase ferredoxin subunit [Streptomyces sp. COG21]MBT3081876.1 non-heme iron oxygenase ferredoxin subunit [Streptomyces sp. COG20]MBT3085091.1 non-heme iron oxygenase ferredoxin subunit [Streptomyces sp. CYG21]